MTVKQVRLVAADLDGSQMVEPVAFFDEEGEPVELSAVPVSWSEVKNKPETFPPVVGTDATDAKPGNWVPTAAEVGAPTVAEFNALVSRVEALENPEAPEG